MKTTLHDHELRDESGLESARRVIAPDASTLRLFTSDASGGRMGSLELPGSADPPEAEAGTVLNGRYTVERVLGRGGMGWVYEVSDRLAPERATALKILRGATSSTSHRNMVEAEFRTMAKLEHPNVARVYDFEELQGSGHFVFTMELVDGERLDRACEGLGWSDVVGRAVQVCRALSYVHVRGIVHLDLKPANILVDRSGTVKVVDFGVASTDPAAARGFAGTFQYMAPELLVTRRGADRRADLYSLGITLYEVLVGRLPFSARSFGELLEWHATSRVELPPASGVPAWLARIVERLCAREPSHRYRTANEVIAAINAEGGFDYEIETRETRQSYVLSPPFLGRQRELDQVGDFLSGRIRGLGERPALLVAGQSGLGKSRLMREIRYQAQLQQTAFFESNCYEGSLIEYGPVSDLLLQLVPPIEALGGAALVASAMPELIKVAPRLAEGRPFVPSHFSPNPDFERVRLLETLADFFVRAAELLPYALYVNDLQWGARGTVAVLGHLLKRVRDDEAEGKRVRLALVGSYRDDEVEGRAVAELVKLCADGKLGITITLGPLDESHTGAIVRAMLGVEDVPPAFLSRVASETAGNPFFIQEVMRALLENGSVYLDEGRWAACETVGELEIPTKIADVFRRRFGYLSADQQEVVKILAVHARGMDLALVDAALGGGRGAADALLELEARQIAVRDAGGGVAHSLAHDRMRETIYRDLAEPERCALHRRIATALEAQPGAPLGELARHYWEAKVEDKALVYALAAGDRALSSYANEAAAEHFAHALALLSPEDARRAATAERLGDAHARLAEYDEAIDQYRAAGAATSDRRERARVHGKVANVRFQRGELVECEEEAWTALELLDERRPEGTSRWVLSTLREAAAFALAQLGFSGALRSTEAPAEVSSGYSHLVESYWYSSPPKMFLAGLRAWRAAEPAGPTIERAEARANLAVIISTVRIAALGRRLAGCAIEDGSATGSPFALGLALSRRDMLRRYDSQWEESLEQLAKAEQLLRKAGDLFELGAVTFYQFDALLFLGRIRDACRVAEAYNRLAFRAGDSPQAGKCTLGREATAKALLKEGKPEDIEAALARAVALCREDRDWIHLSHNLRRQGSWWLMRGETDRGLAALEEALRVREEHDLLLENYGADVLGALPRAYLGLERRTPEQERALARSMRQAKMQCFIHPNYRSPVLLNHAMWAEQKGARAEADRLFAEALGLARKHRAGLYVSEALYERGRALARRGARERALADLREAKGIAAEGGNMVLADACEREMEPLSPR